MSHGLQKRNGNVWGSWFLYYRGTWKSGTDMNDGEPTVMYLGSFQASQWKQGSKDRLEAHTWASVSYLKAPLTSNKTKGRSVLHVLIPRCFPRVLIPSLISPQTLSNLKGQGQHLTAFVLHIVTRTQSVPCNAKRMNHLSSFQSVRHPFLSPHWQIRLWLSVPSAILLSLVPP